MRQYETFELTFQGEAPKASEAAVDFGAVFTLNEKETAVKGFYAGNGVYKVRFFPQEAGNCSWKVTGSVAVSGALEGSESCGASAAGAHGIVKANGLHFAYEDGTIYRPFGTTVYALVHQEKELVDETMETLAASPFNKVRFCVFPKHYDFNHNEPELFAFEKTDGKFDVNRPCYAFWDMLEARIGQLANMGTEGDLILFHPYDCWGFAQLSKEECLIYLDYLLRRLSAFPNLWWSLANEYDLMERFEESWWAEFAAFVQKNDPYGHLLSNHNCVKLWDFSNENTTHCCIQNRETFRVPHFQELYHKPVIYDECCYEGNIRHNWGNISGFELVNRFWDAFVQGGYCTHGETFMDENDVLWWAKGGKLHGESPARIGFLRGILEELPGDLDVWYGQMGGNWRQLFAELKKDPSKAAGGNIFIKLLAEKTEDDMEAFMADNRGIQGRCGDEAFLKYYGRHCTSLGELDLPSDGSYDVEVIDIWEMMRTPQLTGVNGKVEVKLPGKEGIAVLARKR